MGEFGVYINWFGTSKGLFNKQRWKYGEQQHIQWTGIGNFLSLPFMELYGVVNLRGHNTTCNMYLQCNVFESAMVEYYKNRGFKKINEETTSSGIKEMPPSFQHMVNYDEKGFFVNFMLPDQPDQVFFGIFHLDHFLNGPACKKIPQRSIYDVIQASPALTKRSTRSKQKKKSEQSEENQLLSWLVLDYMRNYVHQRQSKAEEDMEKYIKDHHLKRTDNVHKICQFPPQHKRFCSTIEFLCSRICPNSFFILKVVFWKETSTMSQQ